MAPGAGGIHFAYVLDGEGGGRRADAAGSGGWSPDQGVLWVELDRHSDHARGWLSRVASLEPLVVEAILGHEPRPRCVAHGAGLLVTLRGVNLNKGEEPEDMVAVRGWFDERRAILLRGRPVSAVEEVRQSLAKRAGPTRSAEVLVRVIDALTDRIAERADQMGLEADAIEGGAQRAEIAGDLPSRIADLRSRCTTVRRHVVPQRDMVGRIASEPGDLLTPEDRARLREDAEQLARSVDELDLVRERLLIVQEQLAARVNQRLARNTYLLSVVAAVFLPVGFVTALASVSIAGIPGKNHPMAFWGLCVVLAVLIALELVVLRRMRD